MSPTSRPMFHKARQRVHPSLVFAAATVVLFTIAAFVAPKPAHADAAGNYYYDRYALPWVRAYAPPNTAPGTFDERSNGTRVPRGTGDHY
jgi:hypothetical protein